MINEDNDKRDDDEDDDEDDSKESQEEFEKKEELFFFLLSIPTMIGCGINTQKKKKRRRRRRKKRVKIITGSRVSVEFRVFPESRLEEQEYSLSLTRLPASPQGSSLPCASQYMPRLF
jgi:hypothetical protein